MFDPSRTIKLVTGALFDREPTWRSYLPDAGDWKMTALLLTVPLVVVSGTVAYMLSQFTAGSSLLGMFRPTLLSTISGFVIGTIAAAVVAFIFSALAGAFGGKNSFALGLAAITLAFVPAYIGQALTWLPWIGGLLAFGLSIFALVQLWKIIPLYLEVPDGKRAAHYILSLVASIAVMWTIGWVVNPLIYGPNSNSPFAAMSGSASSDEAPGGMVGDAIRRGALMEEAMKDTYTPPADGRLTESQLRSYVAVVQLFAERQQEAAARMQAFTEKVDADGEASTKDLGTMMRGANEINQLATSEMEIVKEAGGNWAEHSWVMQALMTASRQRNTSDAIAHNFALYQKYADQLRSAGR